MIPIEANELLELTFTRQGVNHASKVEAILEYGLRAGSDPLLRAIWVGCSSFILLCDEESSEILSREKAHEFEIIQDISEVALDRFHDGRQRKKNGDSAELAIHGLIWWGLSRQDSDSLGRHVRFATRSQDHSDSGGRKNGTDLVIITRNGIKNTPLQVKTSHVRARTEETIYGNVVVAPSILLGDATIRDGTRELHEAIVRADKSVLNSGVNRLKDEIRRQRAHNK